jgi:crotonobetainyl-CoA:carnitine CoA-transferase CaiB-like acyl-CoA transferase
MEAFFDDDATWASQLAARYPQVKYGTVEQVGSLWTLGDQSARLDRSSPEVGQHSREILTELGFSDADIESLLASGAVTEQQVG